MEEPVLLLWSDELILLCKWNKNKNKFFIKTRTHTDRGAKSCRTKNPKKTIINQPVLFWFFFFCPSRPARVKKKQTTRMTTTKQKGKTLPFLCDRYIYSGLILRHANFAGSFSGRHSARSLTLNRFHRYIRFLYSLLRSENSVCCCCCDRHRTSKDTVVTRHFLTYKTSREKWREKKILATIWICLSSCVQFQIQTFF